MKVSPLAPLNWPEMPSLEGVLLGSVEAGIKYKGRKDLTAIIFEKPAQIAGVFTKSYCPSAPVEWCQKHLPKGKARAIVINSGNANAFTGKMGKDASNKTADYAAKVFGCKKSEVFLASTGVIGEPMDASGFESKLANTKRVASVTGWDEAAKAIMTTDTYHKTSTVSFEVDGQTYTLNGIAKGSGMIAPDMATMLSFLVTDLPVTNDVLQKILSKEVQTSFNSISVDSDTSTSDTVLLVSACNGNKPIASASHKAIKALRGAVKTVLHELAMLVVRDGEGASKHIEILVKGAKSAASAKKIALSIANSPLVKTAVAGQDANWGRVVMAVGKAGEPANRDKLNIWFGDIRVAYKGQRDPDYSEAATSLIMKNEFIEIIVDVGMGEKEAKVWTCDLTHEYISINADYRS
ncbi:MAG: bifunctional glutamate N-acetyltransferase/amino-acid acetyltransferase ArgJ [Nitratireductor sp.]